MVFLVKYIDVVYVRTSGNISGAQILRHVEWVRAPRGEPSSRLTFSRQKKNISGAQSVVHVESPRLLLMLMINDQTPLITQHRKEF